jgi:large subunit ribosomal protein L3
MTVLTCCVTQLKDKAKVTAMKPGQKLNASDIFKEGELLDIAGTTIGKGFQGKRRQGRGEEGPPWGSSLSVLRVNTGIAFGSPFRAPRGDHHGAASQAPG